VRRLAAGALAGLLVVGLGWTAMPAPASAGSADPKVVLVVGATHGATTAYRSYMRVVAATAARYTSNVVEVSSPSATWPAVRAALQGASIVVYMGHGNGFPSPYSPTLNPSTQNGMGLNLSAGAGDSNTKYYGEHYLAAEVDLAPNALVILSHLCYASGNSEPGQAEPTLTVAKARADNFAAGFLRAGARAVIADGHDDPSWYVEQLFTTSATVEQIWQGAPGANGNAFTFPSVRTPGYTAWSDPETLSGSTYAGFYRSLVGKPTLTAAQVTGGRYTRTDTTPGSLSVPGAAEVVASAGAVLYPDVSFTVSDAAPAPATLGAGTRLRLVAAAGAAPDGSPAFQVQALDGSAGGFVASSTLAPRDSTPPRFWELDAGTGALSPDGDGSGDMVTLAARVSEAVSWRVDVADAGGNPVWATGGAGDQLVATWDGTAAGGRVADGAYTATVVAADSWGNAPVTATVRLEVDTVAPVLSDVRVQAAGAATFTPNGDGATDAARLAFGSTEAGTVQATVRAGDGTVVATFAGAMQAGPGAATWDGRTASGAFAPDGRYTVTLQPADPAGNRGAPIDVAVVAYGALGFVRTSAAAIHPRDGDRFAKTATLSYRLTTPATVTWQLIDPSGGVVATRQDAEALAAGSYAWTWDGRLPSGAWAPAGVYTSRVVATDGVIGVAQAAKVAVNAFRVSLSDSTPARGQLITVTVVTTEPLRAAPRLAITQPGRAAVSVATVRVSASTYRATVRLSGAGGTGTLAIKVTGRDTDGGYNWSAFAFPIR
jgi:flagellar hook assembly protein FlgD